jgi:hypothetical protein
MRLYRYGLKLLWHLAIDTLQLHSDEMAGSRSKVSAGWLHVRRKNGLGRRSDGCPVGLSII